MKCEPSGYCINTTKTCNTCINTCNTCLDILKEIVCYNESQALPQPIYHQCSSMNQKYDVKVL